MTTTCKNCGNVFEQKFCNACGQPADTHRMNKHVLWHDIQHGFFHFDNGIFYTTKQLFTRPGHTIREYLEGKRIHHFRPLSMVIVLASLYAFLAHFFHINFNGMVLTRGAFVRPSGISATATSLDSHFALITLLTLPLYAVVSYWVFKRQGYNFLEHLILNAFVTGQRLVFHLAAFPLLYACSGKPGMFALRIVIHSIDLILMCWTFPQFFQKLRPIKAIVLTLVVYFTIAFLFFGLSISLLSLGDYLSEAGHEMLKHE